MKLAEIQRRFHDAVTGAAASPAGASSTARALSTSLSTASELVRDDDIDAMTRLGVYANAYFARIHGVLVADYPNLVALVGDDMFRSWVVPYLRAYPTRHPSLREAGLHLAAFLENGATYFPPATAENGATDFDARCADLARLERARYADLARLERARVEAFDGADTTALSRDDIAALPPEAFPHLRLRTIATLVDMTTNADEVWDAIEHGIDVPAPAPAIPAPAIPAPAIPAPAIRAAIPAPLSGRTIAVWRRELHVVHRTLDGDELAPLRRLQAGATFGEICEYLDVARALELLLRWLDAGVLVSDTGAVEPSA